MNKAIIHNSTRLYGFLLKLYPQTFRQAFGEEMAYVFSESLNDACAERGGRGIPAFWGRTIADVGKSVVIQHIEDQKENDLMNTKNTNGILHNSFARAAVATALILLLPLAASLLVGSFNWGLMDFVITGVLLFVAALTYDLITKKAGSTVYRVAFAVAIATAAFLFFANIAVGIIGSEDELANLMYLGVIAVAAGGAILVRFRAAGMERVMFATAIAQALTVVVALVFGMHTYTGSSMLEIAALNGFFIALWVIAGLLFRWASESDYRLQSKQAV